MLQFIASIRYRLANGSVVLKVGAILFFIVAIGFFVRSLQSKRLMPDNDDVNNMVLLYKCSNPDCGNVLELNGREGVRIRNAQVAADIKAGGTGYPKINLPCPKCGHQLLRAERLPSGEVRTVNPAGPPPIQPATKTAEP